MTVSELKRELSEVARIGRMFVDGDLCRGAYHPDAVTFMKGDDVHYNPETTVPLKKTLLRLERIARVPCSAALWRARPDCPDCAEVLLRGSQSPPLSTDKPANRGYMPPKLTPELSKVFAHDSQAWKQEDRRDAILRLVNRGVFARVSNRKGSVIIRLFTPVRDSMGDVASALEIFTVAVGTGSKRRPAN